MSMNPMNLLKFFFGTKNERVYTVEGKANLTDSWAPTNSASRFFRVKVSMP